MGNFNKRLERLEHGRKGKGVPIIVVEKGETQEEAWQKHLLEHPEHAQAKTRIIITGDYEAGDYEDPDDT